MRRISGGFKNYTQWAFWKAVHEFLSKTKIVPILFSPSRAAAKYGKIFQIS